MWVGAIISSTSEKELRENCKGDIQNHKKAQQPSAQYNTVPIYKI